MSNRSALSSAAATLLLVFLAGCSVNSPDPLAGGGDDFPNSFEPLGTTITENLTRRAFALALDGVDTDSLLQIPTVSTALGKRTAATSAHDTRDTVWVDSSRLALDGSVVVYAHRFTDSTITRDTTLYRVRGPGDTLVVWRAGSLVRITAPLRADMYRITDADGDSVIIDTKAARNWVTAVLETHYLSGRNERSVMTVEAGRDCDYETRADNVLIDAAKLTLLGADTLEYYCVKDADGDGYLYDYATPPESTLVDLVAAFRPLSKPLVAMRAIKAIFVVFPRNPSKNYAVRYRAGQRWVGGRTTQEWVQTTRGDSTFRAGDTVELYSVTLPSPIDSLSSDTAILRTVLGPLPADSADDSLTGIYVHTHNRWGAQREVVFSFTSAAPFPGGTFPDTGSLYLHITRSDLSWIGASGTLGVSGIDVEATGPNGVRWHVLLDRSAHVIRAERLDTGP